MSNHEKSGMYSTPKPPNWQVYEARKKQIIAKHLPYHEYETAIRKLVEELGL